MNANLKNFNIGNKVSKLTLEHESTERNPNSRDEVIAIAILLGGYNELGREIPLEVYEEIKGRFNECIHDLKSLL